MVTGHNMSDIYLGLMSGTSLDGVDGVLAKFGGGGMQILASASRPFDAEFRQELLELNTPSPNELHRAAIAGNQIAWVYSCVVADLLDQAAEQGIDKAHIRAAGAHGQTIRHQPSAPHLAHDVKSSRGKLSPFKAINTSAYTLQLINPALLAELTGLTVVADFRSRDIAAGGQGAPLVPGFHRFVFGQPNTDIAVLNVGGISNLSVLPADTSAPALGFDCGPGNAMMDAWCLQNTGRPFDSEGAWAAQGQCLPDLLHHLLDEPYFSRPPPKSTGRDLFSLNWLATKLKRFTAANPQDIQNTLTELTAACCSASVDRYANHSESLIVCGGGAFNAFLLARLQARLPRLQVSTSDALGLPPMQVEAAAFAWLARQTLRQQPGNLPSATGAAGPRILGAIYQQTELLCNEECSDLMQIQ
jgi:anhydro-N-acetylmuramic acid kinase